MLEVLLVLNKRKKMILEIMKFKEFLFKNFLGQIKSQNKLYNIIPKLSLTNMFSKI